MGMKNEERQIKWGERKENRDGEQWLRDPDSQRLHKIPFLATSVNFEAPRLGLGSSSQQVARVQDYS